MRGSCEGMCMYVYWSVFPVLYFHKTPGQLFYLNSQCYDLQQNPTTNQDTKRKKMHTHILEAKLSSYCITN